MQGMAYKIATCVAASAGGPTAAWWGHCILAKDLGPGCTEAHFCKPHVDDAGGAVHKASHHTGGPDRLIAGSGRTPHCEWAGVVCGLAPWVAPMLSSIRTHDDPTSNGAPKSLVMCNV